MSADDQIVFVNPQIAHRGVRQIQLQRLPVIAVIERHPYGVLRACEQQPFAHRIFTHRVHGAEVGQARGDLRPCLAAIARAE